MVAKSTQSLLFGIVLGAFLMHNLHTIMHQDDILIHSTKHTDHHSKGPRAPSAPPPSQQLEANSDDPNLEASPARPASPSPTSRPSASTLAPHTPQKTASRPATQATPSTAPPKAAGDADKLRPRTPKPPKPVATSPGTDHVYSLLLNDWLPKRASSQACEADMGFTLAKTWEAKRATYCQPEAGVDQTTHQPNDPSQSALYCFRYRQSGHSGPDSFCDAFNLKMDYSRLTTMRNGAWPAVAGEYRYFDLPEGTMQGACTKTSNFNTNPWPQGHFQQILRPIMVGYGDGASPRDFSACKHVVEHPTLFVARDGKWNLYHSMADFVNAFLVLEALQVPTEDVQVVIFDQDVLGPYIPLWQKAFSPNYPVLTGKPLQERGDTVCYKRAIVALPGVSSFMCKDISSTNPCHGSDVLTAFGMHVIKSFGLHSVQLKAPVVITLISRRPHPEKKNMDRTTENEPELVKAVQAKYPKEKVIIQCLDFAEYTFDQQLEIVHGTNVLAGVHGAGLTHLLFLPSWKRNTAVIEFAPTYGQHYANMARWANSKYIFLSDGASRKNVDTWLGGIQQAVDHVLQKP